MKQNMKHNDNVRTFEDISRRVGKLLRLTVMFSLLNLFRIRPMGLSARGVRVLLLIILVMDLGHPLPTLLSAKEASLLVRKTKQR